MLSARDIVLSIWGVVQFGKRIALSPDETGEIGKWSWQSLQSWIAYALENWSRKRKTPMDVELMVKRWVPIIRGLSAAHSKDELDRCEFEAEEHLAPLLVAPVAQLRDFYGRLCEALRRDRRIPWFVCASFDAWHEVILKKAPDGEVRELRTKLAAEVAELVERDVQPDLRAALIGALQWRAPEDLEKIKATVKAGAKPRLQGRESCLFLVAGDACVML